MVNTQRDSIRYFKVCNKPHYSPDYISPGGSRYWYGKNRRGKFMIRYSDHWGKVGFSTYIIDVKTDPKIQTLTDYICGKTYLD